MTLRCEIHRMFEVTAITPPPFIGACAASGDTHAKVWKLLWGDSPIVAEPIECPKRNYEK
jgi:hypothetical protein